MRENASAAEDIQSITTASVAGDLRDMHLSMLNELPPNDGHRKTILYPHQTHVGFGIALRDHSLRLDELYLAQYVEVDPLPREAKTKASLVVTGKLLSPKHALTGADVYYEPFPTAPAIEWLREPRSYGMPAEVNTLMPRLPERYTYNDGSKGTIELSSGGRFRIPVSLNKSPGINTIMVWIETGPNDDPFPATQICVSGQ